jgi:hypothetical protein
MVDWSNHTFWNNFQRLKLEGLERPFHSCLQICNYIYIGVFINNLGYTLVTIVDKQKKSLSNGATWHLMMLRISRTHVKTISRTKIFYLCSLCNIYKFYIVYTYVGNTKPIRFGTYLCYLFLKKNVHVRWWICVRKWFFWVW